MSDPFLSDKLTRQKNNESAFVKHSRHLCNAGDRNRTGTGGKSRRILSPVRLPVPPRRHPINRLRLLANRTGRRWIRTTEAKCSRFTVCPLWPLGNPSICFFKNLHTQIQKEKADDRTRTDNLLITNQLLCQLSHIGILN